VSRIKVDLGKEETRGRKIYSFIGPTGVGKTTTLAKLAALRAVQQGKRAALITIDTFRIAAVAQLQTYARIMGIPLEVASSPEDLHKALGKHSRCDYVFIDTAGRSPNHEQGIAELKDIFQVPVDIHHYLVLSATSRYRNLLHVEDRFGALPIRSTIFTKIDETLDVSSMVNFLIARKRPISYVTTGQQVPEDIEPASRRKMASILLKGVKPVEDHATNEVRANGSGERT
jgi:flagellar biosynthesis protein FlhF